MIYKHKWIAVHVEGIGMMMMMMILRPLTLVDFCKIMKKHE